MSSRRELLGSGLGVLASHALFGGRAHAAPATAKRAIWLFMGGGPSHLNLFDYKPGLAARYDQDVPASVMGEQRLTTMTSAQKRFPVVPSRWSFAQQGQSGMWMSELLPWTARIADELTLVRSVATDSINHDPAIMMMNTGNDMPGKASFGSWLSYGLGSLSDELPQYVVMTSKFSARAQVQALSARLWSSAYLPAKHAGVSVRSSGSPLLFVENPPGVDASARRTMLDGLSALSRARTDPAPTVDAHLARYELAYKMQSSVPELADVSGELNSARALYGEDVSNPGTFAANCLLARRMLERGVRFVQIYHRGWDAHLNLPRDYPNQCADVDRACYALVTDLKQRGLLEDTVVIWGGEFGRTVYCQGDLSRDAYGRDHHGRCFSMWFAGGGFKPGTVYGETDDYGYNVVRDPVPVRDVHATLLSRFGLDPTALSFPFAGLNQRLIGVGAPANVVHGLLR